MRSEKEEELFTIKLGVYGLIAIFTIIISVYYISLHLKETETPTAINCSAVHTLLSQLEKDIKSYKENGYSSQTARKHNRKLDTALASAKRTNCYSSNVANIDKYLRLKEY